MTQLGAGNLGPTYYGANWSAVAFQAPALVEKQWFIDAVNGQDVNVGNVATAPLKTHAELVRRFGQGVKQTISGETIIFSTDPYIINTVYLLSDLPTSDPLELSLILKSGEIFIYQGKRTVVRVGSFTAVTAQNRATNTPWSVTDGALVWTPYLGKRIRVASGPNVNQTAWIAKDLGAGAARVSSPSDPNYSPPSTNAALGSVNPGIFSIGDTYVIEDLTKVAFRSIDVDADFTADSLATLAFVDCDIRGVISSGGVGNALSPIGNPLSNFIGCRFSARVFTTPLSTTTSYLNCGFVSGGFIQAAAFFDSGLALLTGGLRFRFFGAGSIDADFMFQDGACEVKSASVQIGTCAVFDAPGSGMIIGRGSFASGIAIVDCRNFIHGAHALWGSGNAGRGLDIGVSCKYVYSTSIPSITGAGGDFLLAGATTSRGWDEAGGAYTAALANTWANLAAATPGGLGGSAHRVQEDAHVLGGAS